MRVLKKWGPVSQMPRAGGKTATALAAMTSRFSRDENGAVAMVFGLMAIPCVMLVGFSVDFGRVIAVKTQTQGMLDNAALASAKALQVASSDFVGAITPVATNYWNEHVKQIGHVVPGSSKFHAPTVNASGTEITLKAEHWVKTPFLSSADILGHKDAAAPAGGYVAAGAAAPAIPASCNGSYWQCQYVSAQVKVLLQAGGNNKDTNVEMALMLDITGSMSGQKILDLKLAAKDLVDIIVWNDQSVVKSRVAIAPFSQKVNVGSYAAAVTGMAATKSGDKLITCVTERIGAKAYSDDAPSAANGWIGVFAQSSSSSGRSSSSNYNSSGNCGSSDPSSNETIVPLTSSKSVLHARIDALTDGGYTAGQIGTAWSWYMLSPKWNSIWPTASQPEPYANIATGKLKKIAVLMTDGEYNTQYSTVSSQNQAAALCTAMKAAGIEVYTIGFQAPYAAQQMLTTCATNPAHYYETETGDALRMAFRDIALKVSSIRISK
jgi:Putative Flp pilus-assembly TadE/G-like/von Willebrand factor type A domain